jgi:site-specific recombinase XerD
MRLAEMTGLAVADLNMDYEVALVLGKGRRPRSCAFGAKAGQPRDRQRQPVIARDRRGNVAHRNRVAIPSPVMSCR